MKKILILTMLLFGFMGAAIASETENAVINEKPSTCVCGENCTAETCAEKSCECEKSCKCGEDCTAEKCAENSCNCGKNVEKTCTCGEDCTPENPLTEEEIRQLFKEYKALLNKK